MISDALRSANVFARLAISPDIEPHVARIAGVRRFPAKGGVVAREGHAAVARAPSSRVPDVDDILATGPCKATRYPVRKGSDCQKTRIA